MQSPSTQTPKVIGSVAVAIVLGVGGFLFMSGATAKPSGSLTSSSTSSSSSSQSTPVASTVAPSTASSVASAASSPAATSSSPYKDGTYNATSNYYVPGGRNSLTVTLTISSGSITDVKTNSTADSYQSQSYVDSFNSNISSAVVGSTLDNASQSRVGGASLTTSAFDDALNTITNNAKA